MGMMGRMSMGVWRGGAGAAVAIAAQFASVAENGWESVYEGTPPTFAPVASPEQFSVLRPGFDATGSATTVTDTLTVMKRVRLPSPDQLTDTANNAAVSQFIYSTDTVVGATNSSTRLAPVLMAMWLTPDYTRASTALINVRIAFSHAHARNGRPVAAVLFTATDGVNTPVTTLVSSLTAASYTETGLTCPCYEGTIDLSGLDEGLVQVDAVGYPWVGESFTISTDASATKSVNLCPLTILNDRAGGLGTAHAYVAVGATGTGVVYATEQGSPANFATIQAAVSAIKTFNTSTYSRTNAGGAILHLADGTHTWATIKSQAGTTVTMPLTIVGASRAGTIIQDAGTSTLNSLPNLTRFSTLTLKKLTTGNITLLDNSATSGAFAVVFDQVDIDMNGYDAYNAFIYRTGRTICVESDMTTNLGVTGTVTKQNILIGSRGTGSMVYNMAASRCDQFIKKAASGGQENGLGQVCLYSVLSRGDTSATIVLSDEVIGARGFAVVGSVIEYWAASDSPPTIAINADGNLSATQNVLFMGNSVPGGRINWLYQDTGTASILKSGYFRFNAVYEYNIKSDLFPTASGDRIGNWSEVHRVNDRTNAISHGSSNDEAYIVGSWLGEVQPFGEVYGTDAAPLDLDWATDASSAGTRTGGGDYTPGVDTDIPIIPAGLAFGSVDLFGRPVVDGSAHAGAVQVAA
jgi:hypothetical protein